MQSQEPPVPDGDERAPGGHARHRRRRTDPPVPPDGMPFIRQQPRPRTVAEFVTRRGGDAARAGVAPPPWAHDRADPHGRLDEGGQVRAAALEAGPGAPAADPQAPAGAPGPAWSDGPDADDHVAAPPVPRPRPRPRPRPEPLPGTDEQSGDGGAPDGPDDDTPWPPPRVDPAGATPAGRAVARTAVPPETARETTGPVLDHPVPGDRFDDRRPSQRTHGDRPAPRPRPGRTVDPAGEAGSEVAAGTGAATPRSTPRPGPATASGWAAAPAPAPDPATDSGPTSASGSPGGPGTGPVGDPGRVGGAPDGGPGSDGGSAPLRGPGSTGGSAPVDEADPTTGPASGSGPATDLDVGPRRPRPRNVGPSLTPAFDADLEPPKPEPAARRRRGPGTAPPTRTVSDAARERGLPVREPGTEDRVSSGHGHGHGHGPATPAGRRVRFLLAALLVPCALAALAGVALLWPGTSPVPTLPPQQQIQADVRAVQAADCTPGSGSGGCTGVTVRMADGPRAGSDLVQLVPAEPSTPRFAVGDRVVLAYSGGNPDEAGSYQITDFQRTVPLIWLAGAFALAVLVLGRWRGLAALVALGLSFVVLVLFVLPSILSGNNPLAVAVTGAGVIMFLVLYLSHGLSARTSCAVLGTLVSLALIGGLGALFTATTRLTGLDDTTANLIGTLGGVPIDARGLVLAGLVIGALGVLDDVTVTQASAVWELRDANPSLGAGTLFAAGMRIGRDHVSSAVNTLVLAYAGAALPLMLLFTVSSAGFGQVLTSQDVATEIVRTLVGSIGLVASVPVTTGLAAVVAARR